MNVNVHAGLKEVWGHSVSHSLTVLTTAGSEIDRKIHTVTVKGNVQKVKDNNSEKLGVIQPDQISHFSCSLVSDSETPLTAAHQAVVLSPTTEPTHTHVHWVSDAIQPSHPLLPPIPPTFNFFQHQSLFKWVTSSHQVAKIWEFQLQH